MFEVRQLHQKQNPLQAQMTLLPTVQTYLMMISSMTTPEGIHQFQLMVKRTLKHLLLSLRTKSSLASSRKQFAAYHHSNVQPTWMDGRPFCLNLAPLVTTQIFALCTYSSRKCAQNADSTGQAMRCVTSVMYSQLYVIFSRRSHTAGTETCCPEISLRWSKWSKEVAGLLQSWKSFCHPMTPSKRSHMQAFVHSTVTVALAMLTL